MSAIQSTLPETDQAAPTREAELIEIVGACLYFLRRINWYYQAPHDVMARAQAAIDRWQSEHGEMP
jgi:hypothetical protein